MIESGFALGAAAHRRRPLQQLPPGPARRRHHPARRRRGGGLRGLRPRRRPGRADVGHRRVLRRLPLRLRGQHHRAVERPARRAHARCCSTRATAPRHRTLTTVDRRAAARRRHIGHRAGERGQLRRRRRRRAAAAQPSISADGRFVAFHLVGHEPGGGRHQRADRHLRARPPGRHHRAGERRATPRPRPPAARAPTR